MEAHQVKWDLLEYYNFIATIISNLKNHFLAFSHINNTSAIFQTQNGTKAKVLLLTSGDVFALYSQQHKCSFVQTKLLQTAECKVIVFVCFLLFRTAIFIPNTNSLLNSMFTSFFS